MSSTRDFSLFSLFTAGLACLVPFTNAYTQPKGAEPKGNPIWTPGLNDIVPAGQPYQITWNPTTEGTVTLVLLKGPEDNAIPQYAIVEKIPNSGSYSWTPSDKLQPSNGVTGYGIQLIDDATGQYQYTTQFGISNSAWSGQSSSPSQYGGSSTAVASSASSFVISGYAHPTGVYPGGNSTHAHPTGWAPHNITTAHPTGGYHHTKKPTLSTSTSVAAPSTSASAPPVPTHSPAATGAASTLATSFFGLVFAAGVAVFVL